MNNESYYLTKYMPCLLLYYLFKLSKYEHESEVLLWAQIRTVSRHWGFLLSQLSDHSFASSLKSTLSRRAVAWPKCVCGSWTGLGHAQARLITNLSISDLSGVIFHWLSQWTVKLHHSRLMSSWSSTESLWMNYFDDLFLTPPLAYLSFLVLWHVMTQVINYS